MPSASAFRSFTSCGGASGAPDRLINALRANNVAAVRAVVVSHTHRDHAEGIDELLRAYRTDAVFLPAAETDRYRMFQAGFNECLAKPLRADELRTRIAALLSR